MRLNILNHPLIEHKMATLRDKNTSLDVFHKTLNEISMLMVYEVTKDIKTDIKQIETPIAKMDIHVINRDIVLVPVLRSGLGMLEGFKKLIPNARVGYVGVKRNEETLKPKEYYVNIPKINDNSFVILLDPMLATGGSASYALDILKKHGAKNIKFAAIVSASTGIDSIMIAHPDVEIFVCAKDIKLNEKGYIVPGLGDCGDRLFGTEN